MVMKAFGPEQPSEKHDHVNHIDGNRANNHISNLEWVTAQENELHSKLLSLLDKNGPKQTAELVTRWINTAAGQPLLDLSDST